MMQVDVRVSDTMDRSLKVTATARGYYGTSTFDVRHICSMNYAPGFSVEEIISDMSIRIAFQYKEKYDARCWVERIVIDEED